MSAADNIILAGLVGIFWFALPWIFIRKDLDLHTKSPDKGGLKPTTKGKE